MNDEIKVSKSMLIKLLTVGCMDVDCVDCPFSHLDFIKVCSKVFNI